MRQHVESDATDPNSSGWSTNTAMSEIVCAPSAMAMARSTSTRPGSWRVRGRRSPLRHSDSSPVNVVRSAKSANNREPACDTTPRPSAVTVILGRVAVAFTSKVPSLPGILVLQQAQFPVATGHFHLSSPGHAVKIVKSQG